MQIDYRSYCSTVAHFTIRYDSVYLTCSKKLTGSQLSLPHGQNPGHLSGLENLTS